MADEGQNPRFVKVILQTNIEEKMLSLPPKFVLEYGTQLSDVAKLTVSDGRVWKMSMERDEEHILLHNGFKEFARHYSLSHGHLLHFEYEGMSNFTVHIFDMTCCEISYPVQNVICICDNSPPHPTIKSESKENIRNKKQPEAIRGYRNVSGILSPRHFKSKKPHFDIKLKDHSFAHGILYVPTDFSRKHIPEPQARREFVELELGDGKKWNVALKRKKCGRVVFGGGWKIFLEDNRLKERDVCVFELVKKNVFKVHLFIAF